MATMKGLVDLGLQRGRMFDRIVLEVSYCIRLYLLAHLCLIDMCFLYSVQESQSQRQSSKLSRKPRAKGTLSLIE